MTLREELLLGDSKQPLETFCFLKSHFVLFCLEGERRRHLRSLLRALWVQLRGESLLPRGRVALAVPGAGRGDVLRPRSVTQGRSSFAGLGEEPLGDLGRVQTIYRSLKIFSSHSLLKMLQPAWVKV